MSKNSNQNLTGRISASIGIDSHKQLHEWAEDQNLSLSGLVNNILNRAIGEYAAEKKLQKYAHELIDSEIQALRDLVDDHAQNIARSLIEKPLQNSIDDVLSGGLFSQGH